MANTKRLQFRAGQNHSTWDGGHAGRWVDKEVRLVDESEAKQLLDLFSDYFSVVDGMPTNDEKKKKVVSDEIAAQKAADEAANKKAITAPTSNRAHAGPTSDK